jgi:hypothetical protein
MMFTQLKNKQPIAYAIKSLIKIKQYKNRWLVQLQIQYYQKPSGQQGTNFWNWNDVENLPDMRRCRKVGIKLNI